MVIVMSKFAPQKQQGMVLILSMVVMLVLTLLVTSSVRISSTQTRISRNNMDGTVAFQAAEAGLLLAEAQLAAETSLAPYQANTGGKYLERATGEVDRWQEATTWQSTNSVEGTYSDSSEPPRYIIEFVGTVVAQEEWLNMDNVGGDTGAGRTQMFRVTALGTGKTPSAKSMLQSTYGKRF